MKKNKRKYNKYIRAIISQNVKSICKEHNIDFNVSALEYKPKSTQDITDNNKMISKVIELYKAGKIPKKDFEMVNDFCEAINELLAHPLLKKRSKPEGEGWKVRSVYHAPEGKMIEIAAQGLNAKRGIVRGINQGSWSETIRGVHTQGITIKTDDTNNVLLNSWEDGVYDVEDSRADFWRVVD